MRSPLEAIVSRRWGVRCCRLVDRLAFDGGLARLLEADDGPDVEREALRRLIADATGMARDSEETHWGESAWPVGLAADLTALRQAFETFEAAAGAARERAKPAVHDALDRIRSRMDDYRLPPGDCATWRLLCVLGRKIDADVQRRLDAVGAPPLPA